MIQSCRHYFYILLQIIFILNMVTDQQWQHFFVYLEDHHKTDFYISVYYSNTANSFSNHEYFDKSYRVSVRIKKLSQRPSEKKALPHSSANSRVLAKVGRPANVQGFFHTFTIKLSSDWQRNFYQNYQQNSVIRFYSSSPSSCPFCDFCSVCFNFDPQKTVFQKISCAVPHKQLWKIIKHKER